MIESSIDNFELPALLAALLQRILIIELCSQDFFFFQKWPGCHVWFEKIKRNDRKGKEVKEKETRRKKKKIFMLN